MDISQKLLWITLLAFSVNLPFGYLRQNCEKFTFGWYFYVHISIPAIIFFRTKAGLSWHIIPVTVTAAIIGQLIGGRINKRFKRSG